jgi:Glycosyl transferase family 2
MGAGPELSIVLPCLNEAETLAACITKVQKSLADLGVTGEIVVADNGSTDGSQEIAISHGARVLPVEVRGYGSALRAGIGAATGQYVIMADADDSYALDDLGPYLYALRGGADLVMGNRFAGGIEAGAMPALHRYLGNPVLSFVGRLLFRIRIRDFHCGMRGFRRDKMISLNLATIGMEYASEMVVRAALSGLRITEVPTTLRPDGRTRAPHLRTWRDGWRHLRFLLAFSPRWLFMYPALILVGLGGTGLVILAPGPVRFGSIAFDVQTMLAAATAVVVGVQMCGLAMVSRAYASRIGLMPRSRRLERLLDKVTLEWGLIAGFLMITSGLVAYALAAMYWRGTGFGALDIDTLRLPVFGTLLVVAGAQLILISFMLSLTRIGEE